MGANRFDGNRNTGKKCFDMASGPFMIAASERFLDTTPSLCNHSGRGAEIQIENMSMEHFDLRLNYPLFAILCVESSKGGSGLVSFKVDANECVPLFTNREVAELYIEQAQEADAEFHLDLITINSPKELELFLEKLPPLTDHVIWDTLLQPSFFKLTSVTDLLRIVREK
jgi:hypothetical protein